MGLRRTLSDTLQRTADRQLRIAVTGLSRSGKTAFITSLAAQLQHPAARLEWLTAAREERLLGARRVPQTDLGVPRFPLDEALEALWADPPRWPEPTRGISEMRLALRYRPGHGLRRLWSDRATLYLDIIDYPGEWLLDLPLLDLDYSAWSRQVATRVQGHPPELGADWLRAASRLDPLAPADEGLLAEISGHYTDYLQRCKAAGLAFIQPGRFVLPGDLADAPVLQFFPLPPKHASAEQSAQRGSNLEALRRRYEYYRDTIVRGFYRDHFARIDRQIVLVDCLSALNAGEVAMEDMGQALQAILGNFRYGHRSLPRRLLRPHIDRLVLAATKADHVTPDQHPRLQSLLQSLLTESRQELRFETVTMTSLCLSAVAATQAVNVDDRGKTHPALQGISMQGEELIIYPGDVPQRVPSPEVWPRHTFDFTNFRPPAMERHDSIPHIRMDQALEALIGDHLR